MLRKLAIALSALMHPLLMPVSLFALLFYFTPIIVRPISQENFRYVLSAVFVTTFLLPMVSITALRLSAMLGGSRLMALSMPDKKDRLLPFFFTSLFYVITTYMFFAKFRVNLALVVVLAATTLIIMVVTLTTLVFKISAYGASTGGWIGFLLGLGFKYPQAPMLMPLIAILVLSGLVMSARLYLHEHTPAEILVGHVVGLSISLSAMLLYVP